MRPVVFRVISFLFLLFILTSIAARFLVIFLKNIFLSRLGCALGPLRREAVGGSSHAHSTRD